jgi:hypothetical protein
MKVFIEKRTGESKEVLDSAGAYVSF